MLDEDEVGIKNLAFENHSKKMFSCKNVRCAYPKVEDCALEKITFDLEDKEMYDGEAIDVKYSKYFDGRYTPLKYWKQHKDSRVCVDFTYKPGDTKRFVTVGKKLMINVFEKHELQNQFLHILVQ